TSREWVRRVWMWSLLVTGCTWVLRPRRRKAPEKITRSWSLWKGERPSSSVPCTGLPRRSRLSRECQSKACLLWGASWPGSLKLGHLRRIGQAAGERASERKGTDPTRGADNVVFVRRAPHRWV